MASMTKPKHLILGGLGSVGRFLQQKLVQKGKSVRVLDLPRVVESKSSAPASAQVHSFTLGVDSIDELCRHLETVETVYALATPDLQSGTVREFETTHIKGTRDLLEACQQVGVPKLIFGSSVGVADSLQSHCQRSEEDPLPSIESYSNHGDRTMRLAEEKVLDANNHHLQTCALRFGAILGSPSDYLVRRAFDCPGKVFTLDTKKTIDVLSAVDASRALYMAQQNLDRGAAGQAIYVTQSNDEMAPTLTDIHRHLAATLEWELQHVPSWMIQSAQLVLQWQHALAQPVMIDPPAFAPHLVLELPRLEKTFSNRKAKQLLGYEPTESWKAAIERIVEQYKRSIQRTVLHS